MKMDIRLEWHSPDSVWAAVFMRKHQPWFLNGGLVGMGVAPEDAVADLVALGVHLIMHGDNALCEAPVSIEDRCWLFAMLDVTDTRTDDMYAALREAGATQKMMHAGVVEVMES